MERTENQAKHYQTFEDLEVYQVAREFRKALYRVADGCLKSRNLRWRVKSGEPLLR